MPSPRTAERRRQLVHEQGGKCAYCKRPFIEGNLLRSPTLDHVTSRSAGGSRKRKDNQVAACLQCNREKGRTCAEAFRAKLADGIEQAESLKRALERSVAMIGGRTP